jgi:hypothetical protein
VAKEKNEKLYALPSQLDINKAVRSLIREQRIDENYIPDYDTIIANYIKLVKKNIAEYRNRNSNDPLQCDLSILSKVISTSDRFES